MASYRIGRFCRSILPPQFRRVNALLLQLQAFLEQNLPTPVNQAVTLLTVTDDEIVIAANSPLVANYLRLHGDQLRQQLLETFELRQTLKFRSLPDALLSLPTPPPSPKPKPVSADAVAALKRNANWIDDQDLKAAMLALADSLNTD